MGGNPGFGVTVSIGDGPVSETPSYTEIAQLEDIGGVKVNSIIDEITAHDSPGGFREKIPTGLFDVDDLPLTLIHDMSEATQSNASGGIIHAMLNKTLLAWKIVFPDSASTTWTFDAYVANYQMTGVKDKSMRAVATLTVTGEPALT
jgi:predicted secreted protein